MNTPLTKLDDCTKCPYLDQFHGTCNHELRQTIIHDLRDAGDECPIYPRVRAEAMRELEDATR